MILSSGISPDLIALYTSVSKGSTYGTTQAIKLILKEGPKHIERDILPKLEEMNVLVKPATIRSALSADKDIIRVGKGTYALKSNGSGQE